MADYNGTDDGINLPTRTSDPDTLIERLIWHRSDKKTIDFFVNGEIRSLPETTQNVIDNILLQLTAEQVVIQRNMLTSLNDIIEELRITNENLSNILS